MQSLQNSTTRALDALDIKLVLEHNDDLAVKRIPARINAFADLATICRTMCDKQGVEASRPFSVVY